MSRRVLFNGVVLIRPGAATKIDASQFEDVNLEGLGVVGLIGAAEGGQPRTIQTFRTSSGVKNFFRQGDLVEAAAIAAEPGNDTRITAGAQLLVCYKVNGSTQSTLSKPPFLFKSKDYGLHTNDIQMSISNPDADNGRVLDINSLDANGIKIQETSAKLGMIGKMTVQYLGTGGTMSVQTTATQMIFTSGSSAGQVLSGSHTFNLAPGDTLVIGVDGGADQTFTFNGTKGSLQGNAQPFNLTPGMNLIIKIDGGTEQTFTFNGTQGAVVSGGGTYNLAPPAKHLDVKIDGGAAQVFTFNGAKGTYTAPNETYNLAAPFPKTLVVSIDSGADQTFNYTATQGFKQGAGATYAAMNGKTLVVSINGGADQTVTFTAGETDAATVKTKIEADTTDCTVDITGGQIKIVSDRYGTSSSVNPKAGSTGLVELGLTSGLGTAGTGDASNMGAMTKAEAVAKLAGLVGGTAQVVGMGFTITSNKYGTGSGVQVKNTSTAAALVTDNNPHPGTGDAADLAAVTAAEAVTKLAGLAGGTASVVNNSVKIVSARFGTGSSVQIDAASDADNLMQFDNLVHSGTGDASNLAATTAAEVVTKLGGLVGATPSVQAGKVQIESNRIGSGSGVQVMAASTADGAIGFDNVNHSGTGDASDFAAVTATEVVTKLGGLVGATPSVDGTGSSSKVKITSNTTGASSSVQVQSTSTADTKMAFDNLLHTGTNANAADNLTINFSEYPTLDKVIRKLNSYTNVFSAAALIAQDTTWDTTYFDAQTVTDIKATAGTLYARNWDIKDWIDTNSSLITVELTKGQTAPITPFLNTTFSGGTRGTSTNSDWATGFTRMGGVRINQIVPLCSEDGGNGDTYTFDSVSAGMFQHAKYYSSTAGRSERQTWIGMKGTKSQLIGKANIFNSHDVCLVGQKIKRFRTSDGEGVMMPEWAMATALAGLRAGAPLGEPLTWKYILAYGISNDNSWSTQDKTDIEDMILNGVMLVTEVQGKGFRIERGLTTYIRTDNDAYSAEEVVQAWKAVSYELRTRLEDKYIGRPNSLATVQTVPSFVIEVMSEFEREGLITASIVDNVRIPAFRNITVQLDGDKLYISVTFSPVQGINFILNTLIIVPARISLAA